MGASTVVEAADFEPAVEGDRAPQEEASGAGVLQGAGLPAPPVPLEGAPSAAAPLGRVGHSGDRHTAAEHMAAVLTAAGILADREARALLPIADGPAARIDSRPLAAQQQMGSGILLVRLAAAQDCRAPADLQVAQAVLRGFVTLVRPLRTVNGIPLVLQESGVLREPPI